MAARSQPYRLEGEMTPAKMEQLDEMLQILFDDLRNGNLTITTTQLEDLPLDPDEGGTGLTSYTIGDILYADDTDSLTTLGIGTAQFVLQVNAGATAPEWGLVGFDNMITASASTLIGRRSGSTGNYEVVTLGAGLTMSAAAVLSSTSVATPGGDDGDVQYNDGGSFGGHPLPQFGYWSPLTNGDPVSPELIFDGDGDTVAVWTSTGP